MAQKTIVQLVDDLNGTQSDDISTVLFALDGVSYEIDLTEDHAQQMRDSLFEFVEAARRTGGRIRRGVPGVRAGALAVDPERGPKIREWALRNNFEVAERGRLPISITKAFDAAHANS